MVHNFWVFFKLGFEVVSVLLHPWGHVNHRLFYLLLLHFLIFILTVFYFCKFLLWKENFLLKVFKSVAYLQLLWSFYFLYWLFCLFINLVKILLNCKILHLFLHLILFKFFKNWTFCYYLVFNITYSCDACCISIIDGVWYLIDRPTLCNSVNHPLGCPQVVCQTHFGG